MKDMEELEVLFTDRNLMDELARLSSEDISVVTLGGDLDDDRADLIRWVCTNAYDELERLKRENEKLQRHKKGQTENIKGLMNKISIQAKTIRDINRKYEELKTRYERLTNPHPEKTTLSKRETVLIRDNFRCQCCGVQPKKKKIELHHIIFRSKGGSNEVNNLISLCHGCHTSLHNDKLSPKLMNVYNQRIKQIQKGW